MNPRTTPEPDRRGPSRSLASPPPTSTSTSASTAGSRSGTRNGGAIATAIATAMAMDMAVSVALVLAQFGVTPPGRAADGPDFAVPLPEGIRAVWDPAFAHRESTPTRERVCLNGLWRWQPAGIATGRPPAKGWGYFKVPGPWPGITDYMQKDSQTVRVHPAWQDASLREISQAWYEREFTIPAAWQGRRIALSFETLHSHAEVFVDGVPAGEARFPGGEVDLSAAVRPGATHQLSLRVTAMPLRGVLLSYTDSASAREVKGAVPRRGLCGDVFLFSTPSGPRVRAVRVEPSVRRGELRIDVQLGDLAPSGRYQLRGRITAPGGETREFEGAGFTGGDTTAGGGDGHVLTVPFRPAAMWDAASPENLCGLDLTLVGADGLRLDVHETVRFGFREFWIEGRDFILNGRPIQLSMVPLDNAQVGAAWATYGAARESLERLRDFGINFVYTHHYDCLPGSHLDLSEILRAADDVGMLVALSQPHFSHYDWAGGDADRTNGYARHADHYARVAGNHPSVVMYAMSHNATGYNEDMNPDMIDGVQDARDDWARRNARSARRAEAIVHARDPGRIVYHHASGNLGPLHAINFYPNFVPIQELSDWFEPWATRGVKPVFLCEYGAPFTWDWTLYRGWYNGQREFGSARVPWEFCLAEWNAQFIGDRAFPASEPERANLRWEAKQYRAGNLWHRWDYPAQVGSTRFEERYPIFAEYITDNWRAFRTWGVSATSPWEHGHFWKLRDGVDRSRKALPVDWDRLQRPGFSPDYLDQRYERMDLAYERADWIPTPAADALLRNNRPLLAYIAGDPARLTSKDHLFHAGEAVEKTLVILNNARRTVTGHATWTVDLPDQSPARHEFRLQAGSQERFRLPIELPPSLPPGRHELRATVRFDNSETQVDVFPFDVLPRPGVPSMPGRIALFDPVGQTAAWLERTGIHASPVDAAAGLDDFDLLVVGKSALTVDGPAPDLRRVRDGLKVIVFEQSSEVLERRLGFRVTEYGLRRAFPRVPDHPLLDGIGPEQLRDWRGEATLLSPRLKYEMRPRHGPTIRWCDLPVTRLWRCGNRGNVASVLIEKPVRGDFLPVVDGGFDLQYSPLLEYREGRGAVWFCQLDVTGRTASDPAAETIARNVVRHALAWKSPQARQAVYAGDPAGRARLTALGFSVGTATAGSPAPGQVLILGPGGPRGMKMKTPPTGGERNGGSTLALGLGAEDLAVLPSPELRVQSGEHLSTGFAAFGRLSPFAGIGPADVHLREPVELSRITAGARTHGDGILAEADAAVFCQVVPWRFADPATMNLKRTDRRLAFLLSRLISNQGVASSTPLLERFSSPIHPDPDPDRVERRWLEGFYLDQPAEWDDPYRFFRW